MSTSTLITEQHLPQIEQALRDLDTLERELELAVRAGLTAVPGGEVLNDIVKRAKDARAVFQQIKNVYFPGQ